MAGNEQKLFRFLEWEVYKDVRDFSKSVFSVVNRIPRELRFELGSQLIRSATSIALNIAEGSGKGSDTELNRYFNIALGSANETVANLDILKENKFITEKEFSELFARLEGISRQLGGFKKSLKQSQ